MVHASVSSVITHIAAWILFLSLPVLFVTGNSQILSTLGSIYTWLFFITYIFIFYFNAWFLLPQLYLKKKYFLYTTALVVMLVGVWMLRPFDRMVRNRHSVSFADSGPPPHEDFSRSPSPKPRTGKPPGPGEPPGRSSPHVDIISIFLYLMVLAMSIAIQIRRQLLVTEQRAVQAEADKANAELSFLKAQINPHFLFNTLNNIYSLAASKSDHTAESIMKLSNIMRYVTDDVREEFVPLENEVAFISDYIDLQRLRLGDKINIGFLVSGKITGKRIAPLILMTFIENVFKYGISSHEPSAIDIQLSADKTVICFFCRNKLYEGRGNAESTGIGIANTRQRLEHLYSDRHELAINIENGMYSVQLILYV